MKKIILSDQKINAIIRDVKAKTLSSLSPHEAYVSGEKILALCPHKQVNNFLLFLISNDWNNHAANFVHPWFDFENPEVRTALVRFVNTVSRHVRVRIGDLDSLLDKTLHNSIRLILDPEDTFARFFFAGSDVIPIAVFKKHAPVFADFDFVVQSILLYLEKNNLQEVSRSLFFEKFHRILELFETREGKSLKHYQRFLFHNLTGLDLDDVVAKDTYMRKHEPLLQPKLPTPQVKEQEQPYTPPVQQEKTVVPPPVVEKPVVPPPVAEKKETPVYVPSVQEEPVQKEEPKTLAEMHGSKEQPKTLAELHQQKAEKRENTEVKEEKKQSLNDRFASLNAEKNTGVKNPEEERTQIPKEEQKPVAQPEETPIDLFSTYQDTTPRKEAPKQEQKPEQKPLFSPEPDEHHPAKTVRIEQIPVHKQFQFVQKVFAGSSVRFKVILDKINEAKTREDIELLLEKYVFSSPDVNRDDRITQEFLMMVRGRFDA